MSEYQYYEFLAVDRPLDAGAQEALRAISSRAQITATGFVNEYNYGDLKANPLELVKRWFDLFVYTGFYSTRRLMIRLPRRLFDLERARAYTGVEAFTIVDAGENVVLVFNGDELDIDGAEDDGDWMAALAPLRSALMDGDYRCLYLAWLKDSGIGQTDEVEDDLDEDGDILEPQRPPGLSRLDGPLTAFVDFLQLDEDLVAAAGKDDHGPVPEPLGPQALEAFVLSLPVVEKDAMLVRLLRGESVGLVSELRQSCRLARGAGNPTPAGDSRRLADLHRAANDCKAERRRREEERAAADTARRQREEAEARSRRLDHLARRGLSAWRDVESEIAATHSASYDRAVGLLVDLRDLAEREGTSADFGRRIAALRTLHSRKAAMIARFDRAGLRGQDGDTGKNPL